MRVTKHTTTHYEPRILEFPDDPENSHWHLPDGYGDEGEPTATTPEEALKNALEYCTEGEAEALVIVKVTNTYLKPSKKNIKDAEQASAFEKVH